MTPPSTVAVSLPGSTAPCPKPPPLSLYVHLPWCLSKCPYCDFNSHPQRGDLPETAYVDALLRDLDFELERTVDRELVSIYFGGGTPSLFSAPSLARFVAGVSERCRLVAAAEITLEVNPGTYRTGYFESLAEFGVNRLSIGVQSFDDAMLKRLGRVHNAGQARRTVEAARQAGFTSINIDLMHGLPGQAVASAMADVEAALALGPNHLSHYQLTIEAGTRFGARPPKLPGENAILRARDATHRRLAGHGFEQYEVSAFALAGAASRHNLNYWQFGDYLGIGAGAHGKLTGADGVARRARVRSPSRYLATAGTAAVIDQQGLLRPQELVVEFLLNALRLRTGFERSLFEARTGLAWEVVRGRVAAARRLGLLDDDGARVRASERGWALLDTLLLQLLPG